MRDLSSWKVLIAAVTIAVSLSGSCAKRVPDALDDTTITARVKTTLLNDPAIGGLRIDVDTIRSVVTLSGRVKSQSERDQAMALARQVSGVSEVKDALQIVPDTP